MSDRTALDKVITRFNTGHSCSSLNGTDMQLVIDARSELAALRKRVAELEAAQAIVTPNNCRHCKRAAEQMREAAAVMSAGVWHLKSVDGEDYEHVVTNHIADCIRALPVPACDGCNPLKPDDVESLFGICECACGCKNVATVMHDGMASCEACFLAI